VSDFLAFMQNDLKLSACAAPDLPVRDGVQERLRVELKSNILTIADAREDGDTGSTIYAQRTLALEGGTDAFMILPALPAGIEDNKFFPAIGTVVLSRNDGIRALRAAGTDTNNGGVCQGWIFDARELV